MAYLNSNRYLTCHKLRDIERLETLVVIIGARLRQEERLGRLALRIYMHDVRHGIEAIYPARSIEKPSAIAAPGMIALRISAIGGCQWMVLASAEIDNKEIRLMMPDRETAIIRHRHRQPLAIGRDARHHSTLA